MFTVNDIKIKQNHINSCLDNDFEKRKENLFSLCIKIIDELGITSLERIVIDSDSLFTLERGSVTFIPFSNEILSTIKLSRKTFLQFDNQNDLSLRNEALATIYHEFYHVFDYENIHKLETNNNHSKIINDPYYKIGTKYWSEFYSHYKTKNIHMTESRYKELESSYCELNGSEPREDTVNSFFYILSAVIAYKSTDDYNTKLNDIICFNILQKSQSYNKLASELYSILQKYPSEISLDTFTTLGKSYFEVLDNFGYKCSFKRNKMTFKKLPFERNLTPVNPLNLYGNK